MSGKFPDKKCTKCKVINKAFNLFDTSGWNLLNRNFICTKCLKKNKVDIAQGRMDKYPRVSKFV